MRVCVWGCKKKARKEGWSNFLGMREIWVKGGMGTQPLNIFSPLTCNWHPRVSWSVYRPDRRCCHGRRCCQRLVMVSRGIVIHRSCDRMKMLLLLIKMSSCCSCHRGCRVAGGGCWWWDASQWRLPIVVHCVVVSRKKLHSTWNVVCNLNMTLFPPDQLSSIFAPFWNVYFLRNWV